MASQMIYNFTQAPSSSFLRAITIVTFWSTSIVLLIIISFAALTSVVFLVLPFVYSVNLDKKVAIENFVFGYSPIRNANQTATVKTIMTVARIVTLFISSFSFIALVLPALTSPIVSRFVSLLIVQVEYLEPTHCKLPADSSQTSTSGKKDLRKIAFTSDGKISIATPDQNQGYVFSIIDKCN